MARSAGMQRASIAHVEGSGTMAINVGTFKPAPTKYEPTPPGVNFSIVLLPLLAA